MKRPSFIRLEPDEIKNRVQSLQTIYTQKELSNKLGISVRTLNYYSSGKTLPSKKNVYNNINKLYNSKKNKLNPEKIKQRTEKRQKRSTSQKVGKRKYRIVNIFPDYMYNSPAKEFSGVNNWFFLEQLSDNGYMAGYVGGNDIPIEVQFIQWGEGIKRWGKVINLVGVTTTMMSPKNELYQPQQTQLEVFQVYGKLVKGLNKSSSFKMKMDKLRAFFMNMSVSKGFPVAFLGFYFKEGDEI